MINSITLVIVGLMVVGYFFCWGVAFYLLYLKMYQLAAIVLASILAVTLRLAKEAFGDAT